jgi:hypothetical protein
MTTLVASEFFPTNKKGLLNKEMTISLTSTCKKSQNKRHFGQDFRNRFSAV